jgi:hypothetical protein
MDTSLENKQMLNDLIPALEEVYFPELKRLQLPLTILVCTSDERYILKPSETEGYTIQLLRMYTNLGFPSFLEKIALDQNIGGFVMTTQYTRDCAARQSFLIRRRSVPDVVWIPGSDLYVTEQYTN